MQTAIQISFHNLPPTPSLDASARAELDALERLFKGIVSCRVAIEAPPGHHHKGQVYRVSIELGMPGEQIVVGRAPADHTEHADAHLALRDAFRAARRQLQDRADMLHGHGKAHAASQA